MKKTAIGVVSALLLTSVVALAQRPERDISHARHPNLARAQTLCSEAWQKILEAQKANEFDLGGHAQHAKDLLDQVNSELRQAATVSNEHGH